MEKKNRKPFSTNPFERKILRVILLSAGVPVLAVAGFFYSMFSDLVCSYLNIGLAGHFLYQFLILTVFVLMFYFLFVGLISYHFIHRIVGAFPRVIKELDEKIKGKSKTHIYLRQKDFAKELIDRINALIDKIP